MIVVTQIRVGMPRHRVSHCLLHGVQRSVVGLKVCQLTIVLLCMLGCRPANEDHSATGETDHSAQREVEQNEIVDGEAATFQARELREDVVAASFRIVGAESGLDFVRFDDISGQRRILETNGGGVALLDFDRDGLVDVFLTNGCELPRQADDQRTPSALFINRHLKFENVSAHSTMLQFGYSYGCAIGDFNHDGFDDLYLTQLGRNALWVNNGDGTFTDATETVGGSVPAWSSSAAFADVNGDGWLDLYVVNYVDESDNPATLCPNPNSPDGYQGCSPAIFDGVDDVLFLGDGQGGLHDQSSAIGISGHPGKGLGVVISNLDQKGLPEIYVANDGEANSLFVAESENSLDSSTSLGNERTVRFEERALPSGLALNEQGFAQASMGIAIGDVDANGLADLFLTHFFGDTNTLYLNESELMFRDATRESGLGAASRQSLGFGTVFIDDDSDGRLDLFVANGHVDDRTWLTVSEPYKMRPQFFRNGGKSRMIDVSMQSGDYFERAWIGRGVASGDLNRDGKPDLVVSHQLGPSVLLLNESETTNNSLTLQLIGTKSNRNGIGARVEILDGDMTVVRELVGGGSFQSASTPEIHIGLGGHSTASIRLTWPSGAVAEFSDVHAGHWVIVEDGPLLSLQ